MSDKKNLKIKPKTKQFPSKQPEAESVSSDSEFEEKKQVEIKKDFIESQNEKQKQKREVLKKQNKKLKSSQRSLNRVINIKDYEEMLLDNQNLKQENLIEEKKVIGSEKKGVLFKKTIFEKEGFLLEVDENSIENKDVSFNKINEKVKNELNKVLYLSSKRSSYRHI